MLKSIGKLSQKALGFFGAVTKGTLNDLVAHMQRVNGGATDQDIRDPYNKVVAVFRCAQLRANSIAGLPLMISNSNDEIYESGPVHDLTQCPSQGITASRFWRDTETILGVFGRVYWWIRPNQNPGSSSPIQVEVLHPLLIKPKRAHPGSSEIVGYLYREPGSRAGSEVLLSLEEIHPIIDPDFSNPHNTLDGLSPRHVAAQAITQLYKSDRANVRSLVSGVSGGIAFEIPGNMDSDVKRDFKASVRENHAGVENRNGFYLLEGGMTANEIGNTFKDMEFTDLKKISRNDICAAYGVDPILIFPGETNLGSGKEKDGAQEFYWQATIQPRARMLSEEWQLGVLSRINQDRSLTLRDGMKAAVKRASAYGRKTLARRSRLASSGGGASGVSGVSGVSGGLFAWFDFTIVPALQKAMLELVTSAKEWTTMGVTTEDIINAFDLPFPVHPWMKTWWKQAGLIDVQEETDLGPEPGSVDDPELPLPPEDPEDPETPEAPENETEKAIEKAKLTEKQRAAIIDAWHTSWAGLNKAFRIKLQRHINELRKETLANLSEISGDKSFEKVDKNLIGKIVFEVSAANSRIRKLLGPLMKDAARLGGEQVMEEHAQATETSKQAFDMETQRVKQMVRHFDIRLSDINVRIRKRIAEAVGQSVGNGETFAETAERIRKQFNLESSRAATVSRTEIARALEMTRHEGRNQAGVPLKSWLWSRKETGRPWHGEMETQTMEAPIANDAEFRLPQTGAKCLHPRGTNTPEDDINCGCSTIGRYENDNLKQVLARYLERGFLTYERMIKDQMTQRSAA